MKKRKVKTPSIIFNKKGDEVQGFENIQFTKVKSGTLTSYVGIPIDGRFKRPRIKTVS